MQSKKILFFDNEPYNLMNMHPIADVVFIDEVNPFHNMNENPGDNDYISYRNHFLTRKNTYARLLFRQHDGEVHIPTTGIVQSHIDVLEKWIHDTEGSRFAVFDWDRTILAIEGMLFLTAEQCREGNTSKDHIFEYAMGGRDRIVLLHNMFRMLHDKGIHVFIITNNSSASQANVAIRTLFLETIHSFLYEDFVDNHLIYSGASGNKKEALMQNTDYQFIVAFTTLPITPTPTPIPGGRRSKKLYKKLFWAKKRFRKSRKHFKFNKTLKIQKKI
jgi:hypothetical protein